MLNGGVRRALRLLNRIFYSLYVVPLKDAFIDFTDLSLSHKILAVGGYFSIALMLVLTLLFELFSGKLGLVTYTLSTGEAWVTKQIPTLVMITSSLGVLLGWAFLLTGATDCHPLVFVPVLGFFGFQLFALSAGALSEEGAWLEPLFCLTAPVLLLGTLGLYLLTHRKSYWRNLALVEFAVWFCVMLFLRHRSLAGRPRRDHRCRDPGGHFQHPGDFGRTLVDGFGSGAGLPGARHRA